ncbi:hypothetical protein [Kurthia sibirica]
MDEDSDTEEKVYSDCGSMELESAKLFYVLTKVYSILDLKSIKEDDLDE